MANFKTRMGYHNARCAGRKAARDGKLLSANPWTNPNGNRTFWEAGWWEAENEMAVEENRLVRQQPTGLCLIGDNIARQKRMLEESDNQPRKRVQMKLILITITAGRGPVCPGATHTVTLTWVDTSNPATTVYNVYRSTGLCSGSPVYNKIATGIAPKTYEDTTVQPGPYCYVVTATYASIESAYSPSRVGQRPFVRPHKPKRSRKVMSCWWRRK